MAMAPRREWQVRDCRDVNAEDFTFALVHPRYGEFSIAAPCRFKEAILSRQWRVAQGTRRAAGREFSVVGHRPLALGGKRNMEQFHRYIWELMGRCPVKLIDHIDGNPLNNTERNLRDGTRCNSINVVTLRSDNSSGFRGVRYIPHRRKWRAEVWLVGRNYHAGEFLDAVEAAVAYDAAAEKIHGEYAVTNRKMGLLATKAPRKAKVKR